MSICLCNLSADTVLELAAQKRLELTPVTPDAHTFTANSNLLRDSLGTLYELLPRPIELLVGSARSRRHLTGVVCRVWNGSLPKGSVFALDEGVYVSSPEFTLLQQASQLHQARLCQMLGRYLGTWTPQKDQPMGLAKRAPLTTFESIGNFLGQVGAVDGKNNLRMAMAYTCEGAASPSETSLQLALCLPPELCGLNILQPTMNFEVSLSPTAQRLFPHESIRIDLCWRERRFGLEYQGEEHGSQLGDDCARWFAAREEGYELWFVAKEQLQSATQMMHIGREVTKRIGCDADEILWPTKGEFQGLLNILLGHGHPKPLGYMELRRIRSEMRSRRRMGKANAPEWTQL